MTPKTSVLVKDVVYKIPQLMWALTRGIANLRKTSFFVKKQIKSIYGIDVKYTSVFSALYRLRRKLSKRKGAVLKELKEIFSKMSFSAENEVYLVYGDFPRSIISIKTATSAYSVVLPEDVPPALRKTLRKHRYSMVIIRLPEKAFYVKNVLYYLITLISSADINIYGLYTSPKEIYILVAIDDLDRTIQVLRDQIVL